MDFGAAIGTSLRDVGKSERNGKPTRIVRVSRTYPTSQADLWGALTKQERLQRWFGELSGDFKRGGRLSIKGNADSEIVVCQAPEAFAITWEFAGSISWVNIVVTDSSDGALLTLEHELPTDKENEAHWQQYGPGATGVGWELAFLGLELHLADEFALTRDAGAAWAETDQGKTTLRTWAQAWGETHVRSGAPVQMAQAMSVQTAGFYAGNIDVGD